MYLLDSLFWRDSVWEKFLGIRFVDSFRMVCDSFGVNVQWKCLEIIFEQVFVIAFVGAGFLESGILYPGEHPNEA